MQRLDKQVLASVCTVLMCLPVLAHDYWVDPVDSCSAIGVETEIMLCSGHRFPKQSDSGHGQVLQGGSVTAPDGRSVPLVVCKDALSAKFTFTTNGLHVICFSLMVPGAKEPTYWARSLVAVGGVAGRTEGLQACKGLAIVPGTELSKITVQDSLPLSVAYAGRRIRALVTIMREDGTVSHLRTSPRRPASVKIKKPGKYLVIASVAGKKCSLTFVVPKTASNGQTEKR